MVVAAGPGPVAEASRPDADDIVIAADGGADRAMAAGWPIHHLVGDLDSVADAGRAHASLHGATVHQHPADKDTTDLELIPNERRSGESVIDFCNICTKCAECCPSKSIPFDGRHEVDGALLGKPVDRR